jgi:hypothetical protein
LTNNCLLKVKADASASRIKSSHHNNLIKRQAAERVRLVKEELRRTRLKAERYRSGLMRLSSGGGSGERGGRKRRADAAGTGSGDISGGGGGVDNGSRTMADVGRSGRKRRRRRRRKRRWGDSTPPLRRHQSIRGSIIGQGGDAPINDGVGWYGGVGIGVDGDQGGLTSLGNKQKLRFPIDTIDNDDNNDVSRKSSLQTMTTGVGLQI